MLRRAQARMLVAGSFLLVGCETNSRTLFDADTSGPEPATIGRAELVGTYDASTFEIDDLDQLSRGGAMTLILAADGSTTGRLWLPGGAAEGGDLEADLTGIWDYDPRFQTLEFHPAQEALLGGMSFRVRRQSGIEVTIELISDQSDLGPGYHLVLTRHCECPRPMFTISVSGAEWARLDSNQRPWDYESPALTG